MKLLDLLSAVEMFGFKLDMSLSVDWSILSAVACPRNKCKNVRCRSKFCG